MSDAGLGAKDGDVVMTEDNVRQFGEPLAKQRIVASGSTTASFPDDRNTFVEMQEPTNPVTFTIQTNANNPTPVGTVVNVIQAGAGAVTVAHQGGDANIERPDSLSLTLIEKGEMVMLRKIADPDQWRINGGLAPV